MKERPILFSAEMIRAIRDGRKTQTRRVVSDATSQGNWKASELDLSKAWVDPGPSPAGNSGPYLKASPTLDAMRAHEWPESDCGCVTDRLYPRWFPGGRLWVREKFGLVSHRHGDFVSSLVRAGLGNSFADCQNYDVEYAADNDKKPAPAWHPSIHMPRWASRITLEVTGVRVERIQSISEDDAKAEGVEWQDAYWLGAPHRIKGTPKCYTLPSQAFASRWNALNEKRGFGWTSNCWTWVIEFKRLTESAEFAA